MSRWSDRAARVSRDLHRLDAPPSSPPMTALPPNAAESIRLAPQPAMDAGQPPDPRLLAGQGAEADLQQVAPLTPAEEAILPEVTEVQRLHLQPGDALVVKIGHRAPTMHEAETAERAIRRKLGLSPTTRVLVIGGPDSISTLAGGD